MTYSNTSEAIEALAYQIGENVYLDVAKWHLYLRDAKLHTPLAEQIYTLIDDNRLSKQAVIEILTNMKVDIGGGRRRLPMVDFLPDSCVRDLMMLLEDYQANL